MDAPTKKDVYLDVKPLFPLFPSVGPTPSTASSTQQCDALNWLKNESFTSRAAEGVAELQKKVAEYEAQQNQTSSTHHERNTPAEDIDEPILKKLKLLRKESDRHKSEKDEKGNDKKKKKKSKHKEKKTTHRHELSKYTKSEKQGKIIPTADSFKFPPGKIFLEEIPGLQPEHAYRIDRKGDKILLTYGSLCKSHIAQFKYYTRLCLGSTTDKMFLDSKARKLRHVNQASQGRFFSKKNMRNVWAVGSKLAVRKELKDENVLGNSYINLLPDSQNEQGGKMEEESYSDPFGIMDQSTRLYIQGLGVSESTEDGSESSSGFQMSNILQKVGNYNRRLRETPHDVDLWLEFIKFQDHAFEKIHTREDKISKTGFSSSSKAAIEKKLSIYAKALEANPSSLELKVGQLKLSEDVSSPSEMDKKWNDLLFVHAGNVKVWRYYLLHHQSKLSGFSMSKMVKLYHKSLKTLMSVLEGRLQSADVSENLQDGMIDIFVQYCYFLHHAGHTEKAVASFQALIEFNLFLPPSLYTMSVTDKATVFESFWDSSVARFGETGARGWAKWMEEKSVADNTTPIISENTEQLEENIISQELPKWETWLRIETLRESFHWLPWRPDISKDETEEDCEDLERLVLTDDVTPVLFPVMGSDAHLRLVVEFVRFLGLDTRQVNLASGSSQHSDEYVQFLIDKLYMVSSTINVDTGLQVDNTWMAHQYLHTFIEQVLNQASQVMNSQQQTCLILLSIQFECIRHATPLNQMSKSKCKKVRKFVKDILKVPHNRNNLVIWHAYAKLEWQMGKKVEPLGVLETALGMFSGNCTDDQYAGLCSLYQTYCEILLGFSSSQTLVIGVKETSDIESARDSIISSLSCLADATEFNPRSSVTMSGSKLLKIKKCFHKKYSELMKDFQKTPDVKTGDLVLQHLTCMATFDLCATGIDSALSLFDNVAGECSTMENNDKKHQPFIRLVREEILQRKLFLIQNVFSTRMMPLEKLRSVLNSNLAEFPDSPFFLGCLVDVESRSHISGRLRRHFDKTFSQMSSPIPVIFAVLSEMARHTSVQALVQDGIDRVKDVSVVSETGIIHRVRSLFDRGLAHKAAQHCPLLWRIYIQFEVKFGSIERAKGIFYRSLQQCPWAKVLYKDGVRVFGAEELQEVVDLMTEKEIRIQIPVEEVDILVASEPVASATETTEHDEDISVVMTSGPVAPATKTTEHDESSLVSTPL